MTTPPPNPRAPLTLCDTKCANPPRACRVFTPAAFCGVTPALVAALARPESATRVLASAAGLTVAGAALYGFAFGLWRAPVQGLMSAVKLPLLFMAVVATSVLLNTLLAQLLGYALSLRQVGALVLTGMTISAILLAAWSPIAGFFAWQMPGPSVASVGLSATDPASWPDMRIYRQILLAHTAAVGIAGVVGQVRLFHLLAGLVGGRWRAARLQAIWLAVMGFVGCQLSWLLSPFLGDPVSPPHWVARLYWQYNFYEYVWLCVRETTR